MRKVELYTVTMKCTKYVQVYVLYRERICKVDLCTVTKKCTKYEYIQVYYTIGGVVK